MAAQENTTNIAETAETASPWTFPPGHPLGGDNAVLQDSSAPQDPTTGFQFAANVGPSHAVGSSEGSNSAVAATYFQNEPLHTLLDLDVSAAAPLSKAQSESAPWTTSITGHALHNGLMASGSESPSISTSSTSRVLASATRPSPGGHRIGPAHVASLQASIASLEGECNLIVAGLTREIDDDALRTLFSPFGTVMSSTVMRHVGTGVSRGFGFVLFARESEGEIAIRAMHGSRCGPNTLNVHRSVHDGTIVESNAVFVRNLPLDITAERVADFFAAVGSATSIVIAADTSKDAGDAPNGKRYKVATVTFLDVETAREAVRRTHNKPFPVVNQGDDSPLVIVKFAESAELRRRKHANRSTAPAVGSSLGRTSASSPPSPGSSGSFHRQSSPQGVAPPMVATGATPPTTSVMLGTVSPGPLPLHVGSMQLPPYSQHTQQPPQVLAGFMNGMPVYYQQPTAGFGTQFGQQSFPGQPPIFFAGAQPPVNMMFGGDPSAGPFNLMPQMQPQFQFSQPQPSTCIPTAVFFQPNNAMAHLGNPPGSNAQLLQQPSTPAFAPQGYSNNPGPTPSPFVMFGAPTANVSSGGGPSVIQGNGSWMAHQASPSPPQHHPNAEPHYGAGFAPQQQQQQ